MKIIFFGTPHYALPALGFLQAHEEVVACVTQPQENASAVKNFARANTLPVLEPSNLQEEGILNHVRELAPELGVILAYGKILPRALFSIPKLGCLNIHLSLLPRLRGAAPVQWAILRGEKKTGVTAHFVDEGMDTGPILCQKETEIKENEDADSLLAQLVSVSVETLAEAMMNIHSGKYRATAQQGPSTLAPKLKADDLRLNFSQDSESLCRRVRAMLSPELSFCLLPKGRRLRIRKASPGPLFEKRKIGEVCGLDKGKGFFVVCSSGSVRVEEVQLEGRERMSAWAFWQGARLAVGDVFE